MHDRHTHTHTHTHCACTLLCLTFCDTMGHQAPLSMGLLPGKNAGVVCHFLLQGIFLTQGASLNLPHHLHWQANSLPLSHLERYIYICVCVCISIYIHRDTHIHAHIYNEILLSHKMWNLAICGNMDRPGRYMLSETSHTG